MIRFPADRRMAAPTTMAEGAMELQVALRDLRKRSAPLWSAADVSGRWDLLAEVAAIAASLRAAERQARRLAGLAEAEPACPDGLWRAGHGRAA